MNYKKIYGDLGEGLASDFLQKQGYKIIFENYNVPNVGEIDIIALETKKARKNDLNYKFMSKEQQNEDVLVFVEVKSRNSKKFGQPSEAVDLNKSKRILKASTHFIKENDLKDIQYRYDIIEVFNLSVENHIKNAF